MNRQVKITLKRSFIGRPEKHRRTLRSLGLTRINKTVILRDTPQIRGMIEKIRHLVEVESIG